MDTRSAKNRDQADSRQQQGTDKAPGEEKTKVEQVTDSDLKGKKVDADLSREEDQPLQR